MTTPDHEAAKAQIYSALQAAGDGAAAAAGLQGQVAELIGGLGVRAEDFVAANDMIFRGVQTAIGMSCGLAQTNNKQTASQLRGAAEEFAQVKSSRAGNAIAGKLAEHESKLQDNAGLLSEAIEPEGLRTALDVLKAAYAAKREQVLGVAKEAAELQTELSSIAADARLRSENL